MTTKHIKFTSPFPTMVDEEGKSRIVEYPNRHRGAAPDAEHEVDRSAGLPAVADQAYRESVAQFTRGASVAVRRPAS